MSYVYYINVHVVHRSIATETLSKLSMQLFFFFLSLILLVLASKFRHSKKHRKNLPPSPPALPIIGHLHLLKPPVHRRLYDLSQKHGPIIFLSFGSRPVLIVSSLSAAEECFTKNDIVFANRPRLLVGRYVGYNYTTMVQASYGDHWRNLRRLSTIEVFSTYRLNHVLEIRKEEIRKLLINLSNNSLHKFSKVELRTKFYELTFGIIMRMVIGKRYNGEVAKEEARQFRELTTEAVSYGGVTNPEDYLPILNWIDGGEFKKRIKGTAKRTNKYFQELIDEQRSKKKNSESESSSFIDHLLCLQESEPEYYTDDIIKGLIQIMLFAGIHTTSVTLEWAMANVLNHQSTLRNAMDEIDTKVGKESLLDESRLSKLPYLQNIISETLRLYPPAPLLVPHISSNDCSVGGYDVPCGTMLLVNVWAIHRDPALWEDPTSFKPERFDQSETAHKVMPFGLGRRSCPGAGLAQRVVGLALGSLIQCFDWERACEREIDMAETKGITMPKAEPLEALCKARPLIHKILSQKAV